MDVFHEAALCDKRRMTKKNWIFGGNTILHAISEIRVNNGVMKKSGDEKDGESGMTKLKSALVCEFSGLI